MLSQSAGAVVAVQKVLMLTEVMQEVVAHAIPLHKVVARVLAVRQVLAFPSRRFTYVYKCRLPFNVTRGFNAHATHQAAHA